MKSHRPAPVPAKQAPKAEIPASEGLVRSWVRFWFTPVDPAGLHVLRLLTGCLFLAWLLPLAGQRDSLFGLAGWFDQQAYAEAARLPDGPPKPLSWSLLYICGSDPNRMTVVYWGSIGVLALFTLGVWPRVTAVLTWIIVASFTANPVLDYDADAWLLILAFYLMIGYLLFGLLVPVQRALTGDPFDTKWSRLLGPFLVWPLSRFRASGTEPAPSLAANLAVRLLQVHVAIVILVSGLHKLQISDWWGGVALWYPLYPPFETTLEQAREHVRDKEAFLGFLSAGAYLMLAWQIGFPLFAWKPRLRFLVIGGGLVGWLGMAYLYQMPLFGPAMLIGCLSFVSPTGWRRLLDGLTRLPGMDRLFSRPENQGATSVAGEKAPSLAMMGKR